MRQRWRLIVRRERAARDLTHREVADAWEAALDSSELPILRSEGARPRAKIAFGAPVPVGMTAEREPIEIFLSERCPVSRVRMAIEAAMPAGHSLVEALDVWVGAPPIGGQVWAADYAVDVPDPATPVLEAAIAAVLGAPELVRDRARGERVKTQDLRPLIAELACATSRPPESGAARVLMRLRHDPEHGVGRPDDVLAALSDVAGRPIVGEMTRLRVWLAEDGRPGAIDAPNAIETPAGD